jgi:DNA primase
MSSDFAQTVKQQADIVRVIGEYVRLKKAGAQNYSGLCPFHGEKTPSFSVHATRQFYHCFGCGVSGDVFSFVQKLENVGFPESVKIVALKCGIALPKREFSSPEEAAESRQRTKLLDLHEKATVWFQEQLQSTEGARAREYLTGRGLTSETVQQFRIGYAPEGFQGLRSVLERSESAEILRLSGLFSSKEQENGVPGTLYDRFRKRITFPIANESGRVIAFTARALETGAAPTANEKAGPKYLNSPETPLYSKGQVLFNLDKAKAAIRAQNFALLVEGQMDCISVYTAGITNVLATSGTAFTEHQVRLLRRYVTRVVINFDPDTAGANAAEKSISMLTEEGFEVRVVTLEDGLDPDRYIRERGIRAYAEALKTARRHSDYLIDRARVLFPPRNPEAKVAAVNYLLPHIRRMPSPIARDEFAADVAQKLGIDSAVMREELKLAASKRRDAVAPMRATSCSEAERVLLRALALPMDDRIFAQAVAALGAYPECFASVGVAHLIEPLRLRSTHDALDALEPGAGRAMLAEILMREGEGLSAEELDSAVATLRHHHLQQKQRAVRAEIAEAERRGDPERVLTLTTEKLALDRALREAR